MLRMQPTRSLRLQATPKMMRPMPKEEHSGIVLGIAIGAAAYSIIRKFYTDGTLRLYRSRGHNQASKPEDTKPH
ncbi:hypothetical protein LTR28_005732 [Elasticomyces elasticus]|nr:hypothetical protein LTR28_005732 [Elasticomyces elasticus]